MGLKYTIYFDNLITGYDISEDVEISAVSSLGGSASTNDFLIKIPNIVLTLIDEYGENPMSASYYYDAIKRARRVYLDIEYDATLLFRGYASLDVLRTYYDASAKLKKTDVSFYHIFDIMSRKVVNFKTSTITEMQKIVTYIIENAISSTQLYAMSDIVIYAGDPLNDYSGAYIKGKFDFDKVYLPFVPDSSPEGYLKIGQEIIKYGSRKVTIEIAEGVNVYWLSFYPYPDQNYRSDDLTDSDRAQFGTLPEYYDTDTAGILKTRPYTEETFTADIDIKNIFENTSDSEQEQRFTTVYSEGAGVYLESELKNIVCYGVRGATLYELKPFDTTEILPDPVIVYNNPLLATQKRTLTGTGNFNFMGYVTNLVSGVYYLKLIRSKSFCMTARNYTGAEYPFIAGQYGLYGSDGKKKADAVAIYGYNDSAIPHRIGVLPSGTSITNYVFSLFGTTTNVNYYVAEPFTPALNQMQGANIVYHDTTNSLIDRFNYLTPVSESTGKGLILVMMKTGVLKLYECTANNTRSTRIEDLLTAGVMLWEIATAEAVYLSHVNGVISANDLINTDIGIYKFAYIDSAGDVKTISFFSDAGRNYALAGLYNNETLYNLTTDCTGFAGMLSAYYSLGVPVDVEHDHIQTTTIEYYLRKKIHVNDLIDITILNRRAIDVLNDYRKLFLAFMFIDRNNAIIIRSISRLFESYTTGDETTLTSKDIENITREAFDVENFTPGDDFLKTDYLAETFNREKTKIFRDYNEIITLILQKDTMLDYFDYISVDGAIGVVIGVKVTMSAGDPVIEYTALMRKTPDITALFGAL